MLKTTHANGNGHVKNGTNGTAKVQTVSDLKRVYNAEFQATPQYVSTLPDMQNTPNTAAHVAIQHVGIHNFRIPMTIRTSNGDALTVHASVTGTVSLEAHKKGINMSRIMRSFYEYEDAELSPETLHQITERYLDSLETASARIAIAFDYPIRQPSLRSGLSGYQYYPVVLETRLTPDRGVRHFMHLDFTYSSTCPCSYELSVHANLQRGVAAVPHSQRSVAQVAIEFNDEMPIEDLAQLCRDAMQTETQVMVKRQDEQAFAELNAANLKFVEDAVRLFYKTLDADARIKDFRVYASHQESLHSHDAISVITKGVPGGFEAVVDPFRYGGGI